MVITLDPWNAQQGTTALDLPALGVNWGESLTVHDEITGGSYVWGQFNYVRLEPWHHVAHIFRVSVDSGRSAEARFGRPPPCAPGSNRDARARPRRAPGRCEA